MFKSKKNKKHSLNQNIMSQENTTNEHRGYIESNRYSGLMRNSCHIVKKPATKVDNNPENQKLGLIKSGFRYNHVPKNQK
jgi:hypothetical protein